MEAATPLHRTNVRTIGGELLIDGLAVDDATAVRLAREREEAGEDPAKLVSDAIEIGARVLDREQTGANVEMVKTEFERSAREVEARFAERARTVAEEFAAKVDEVFGPENGHLAKALARHFSDESSAAVQHRVKALVDEVMAKSRADLLRQFSSADGSNPLAGFQKASLAMIKQASDQQDTHLRALLEKLAALELEVAKLHAEREKHAEVEAERERGTAKGRSFEEAVHEALDQIAAAQGDDCEAVGDVKGATGRTGDIVIGIDGCRGPARGRVVFEAKNSRLSRKQALGELDQALAERDADFAVLVVPAEDKLPAKVTPLREFNGDKLVVCYDPEEGSRLALEVAYSLARARVLMAGGGAEGVDAAAVRETVERALTAMEDVRRVKSQLTGATTSISSAREILDSMAASVRSYLGDIDALLTAADPAGEPAD